jgi:hypothetical protein
MIITACVLASMLLPGCVFQEAHVKPSPKALTTQSLTQQVSTTPTTPFPSLTINTPIPTLTSPFPGIYILYVRDSLETPETASIRYISPESGEIGTLTEEASFQAELSPDSRLIAFLKDDGNYLHILDILEGFVEEIHLPDRGIRFTWTPEGDSLIVETMDEMALFDPWSGEWSIVYSKRSDTDLSCISFKWSPDERWVAYSCARESSGPSDPRNGIYVMDASCLREKTKCNLVFDRQLPEAAAYAWSPDGQILGLCGRQDGNEWELYTYSPDTGDLILNQWCGSLEKIEWSPNGDQIAGSSGSFIDLFDLDSGDARVILDDENMVRLISWIQLPIQSSASPLPDTTPTFTPTVEFVTEEQTLVAVEAPTEVNWTWKPFQDGQLMTWEWDVCFTELMGRQVTLTSRGSRVHYADGFIREDTGKIISLIISPNSTSCDHHSIGTLSTNYFNATWVLIYSGYDEDGNVITLESPTILSSKDAE